MAGGPLADLDARALGDALAEMGVDGWLLFDFRHVNPVAGRVLGEQAVGMGTRRLFVLLPRTGKPVAIAHRIEQHALAGFPGEVRPYSSWRELHAELRPLVANRTLAMEVSPGDAVPYLDRVPAGVVELVQSLGGRVVPSAPLVTRFAARWNATELEGHRRAARAIAEIAGEALRWAGAETARGAEVRETTVQGRVLDAFARAGLFTDEPPIAAFQENSALPHYQPHAGADRRLQTGQVVLLDLWAGPGQGTVFADQTWMAFAGRSPDAEVRRVWDAVWRARDGVVERLREQWGTGSPRVTEITGADLDDVARGVIRDAGYGAYFVHRTGHSIDRELHGSGPHLDNYETADTRALIAGVGFSVEPGVYLPGRFGMRSEINVYLGETGPEVTPPAPQTELLLI
ncbi:MAG TPA: M24 family metallopeptidase [Gemmatimonadales bacterium]|nr:M24 family metallopeptidase [Gemmatimonadales bacterium]